MDQEFLKAVWLWVEACEESAASGGPGTARAKFKAVKEAARKAGITSRKQLFRWIHRAMNYKFPQGSFRAFLAALETNFGGAAGAGGASGTVSMTGLGVGAVVCVVVAVAALGCYTLAMNRRDYQHAMSDSQHLYQNYLIRFARFQTTIAERHPNREIEAPLPFQAWLQLQGTKVTTL